MLSERTRAKIEEALFTVGASAAFFGVIGYALARRETKQLATATERSAALGLPGAGEATNGATSGGGGGGGGGAGGGTDGRDQMPKRLTGSTITLEKGRKYITAINVRFPLSLAASTSKIRTQAEEMGFRDVQVFKDSPPAGSPPVTRGADYYVVGTYGKDKAAVGRSHAGGQVVIEDVWLIAG